MAEAIVTLPDGRRARLSGPTREAILAEAERLGAVTPRQEFPLGSPEALRQTMELGTAGLLPTPEPSSGLDVAMEFARGQRKPNSPLILGSIAGAANPPLAAGRAISSLPGLLGLLSRTAQRVAPPAVAGGGVGGGVAAIEEARDPESTPASILQAGLETGGRLAAAELAGTAITTTAAKIAAPRLGFFDPLKDVRRALGEFAATVPEKGRAAVRRIEELLPEGRATDAAVAIREAAGKAQRVIVDLVESGAVNKALAATAREMGPPKRTAESLARALGEKTARQLGYGGDTREFVARTFFNLTPEMAKTLQRRMGKTGFKDFQLQSLSSLLTRASVRDGGKLRLNGERLRELWEQLPEASRGIFSQGTQRAVEGLSTFATATGRLARFAASPTGSEAMEMIITPAAFAVGGPVLGIPVMAAKALLFPGPLARYLSSDRLPNEFIQRIGRQSVVEPIRLGFLEESEND